MANPRLPVRFNNIDYRAETFIIDDSTITYDVTKTNGSTQVGLAVTLSAADTIALVADAEGILGKLIKVEEDNRATVQTRGYMTLPAGTSAALTLNKKIVGDLLSSAKGYIREAAAAAGEYVVMRGRIENAATTTAVVVYLE